MLGNNAALLIRRVCGGSVMDVMCWCVWEKEEIAAACRWVRALCLCVSGRAALDRGARLKKPGGLLLTLLQKHSRSQKSRLSLKCGQRLASINDYKTGLYDLLTVLTRTYMTFNRSLTSTPLPVFNNFSSWSFRRRTEATQILEAGVTLKSTPDVPGFQNLPASLRISHGFRLCDFAFLHIFWLCNIREHLRYFP